MADDTQPTTPDQPKKDPTNDKSWLEMENLRGGDDPFSGGSDGVIGSDG